MAAAPARGRPARLSCEQIIDAAVAAVAQDPTASLTIKSVADAVGAAPMALYRYFEDREALLQAAADRVLASTQEFPLPGNGWEEQTAEWMRGSQERLRRYPALLPYMAATQRPAWLTTLHQLATILAPARLRPEDLALAITLIGSTVVGHAMYQTRRRPVDEMVAAMNTELAGLPAAEQAVVAPILPHMTPAQTRLHEVVIEQTIATIRALQDQKPMLSSHDRQLNVKPS
jgi:TetR/AcrR family tetracycline transcriptional repressor